MGGTQPLSGSGALCCSHLSNTEVINTILEYFTSSHQYFRALNILLTHYLCSIFANAQPGRQLPTCQPIPLPPSHRWPHDDKPSSFDIFESGNIHLPSSAPHHHHHHYSLGASEHAGQPDKEPVANAPLGKFTSSYIFPSTVCLRTQQKLFNAQISRLHHHRVVLRAVVVEPTETSLLSNPLLHSDPTPRPHLSIRCPTIIYLPPVIMPLQDYQICAIII